MTTRHARTRRKTAALLTSAAMALALQAIPAYADAPSASPQSQASEAREFNLAAGPLDVALTRFSEQSGVQLVYDAELVRDRRAPAIRGRMAPDAALARLLAGQGLTSRFLNANTITIERDARTQIDADGSRVLGPVIIEGAQASPYNGGAGQNAGVNGVNGSRDITATENTGSFTSGALTVGSKSPQALEDVPQSISVLTFERLQQQNITDFNTAMNALPGITVTQGDNSLQQTFISRGFDIRTIQIDGGAPITTDSAYGFYPQLDMAQYDHVELLRGASGLFNGFGVPGGSVNLVRKKPLDHAQTTLEAQVGSWDTQRLVFDTTGPLAFDGRLRGRLVGTWQNNHYFYDLAQDAKRSLYGVAEFDLDADTLIRAGFSRSDQNSLPWDGGLPRYQTGEDLHLPRSTSFALPWFRWDFETTEIFGAIERKFGDDWTVTANLTNMRQASVRKLANSNLPVNPLTGTGPGFAGGNYVDTDSDQLSAEVTVNGAFSVFGQRQEVIFGINSVDTSGGGGFAYGSLIYTYYNNYQPYPGGPIFCQDFGGGFCAPGSIPLGGVPINVFNFDPNDPNYREPPVPIPSRNYTELGQSQTGAFLNVRLTAFDRWHLTTGIRWSQYEYATAYDRLCNQLVGPCVGRQIGDPYSSTRIEYSDDSFTWPPAVHLSYDVTDAITAYLGWTDINESQASYLTADEEPLDPITGENAEAGVKWAARGGLLNLSIAAYQVTRKGAAEFDFTQPYREIAPGITCCWLANQDQVFQSRGLDFEATGEIRPGWQVAASYTLSETEQRGASFGSAQGQPFQSIQPKNLYKVWLSYDFAQAQPNSRFAGLTLSGGVRGQSAAYRSGSVCVNLAAPDPVSGSSSCVSYSDPDYVPFEFTIPAYAVVSARVDYAFSPTWSLSANFENLFDETYYQGVGSEPGYGNWYGAPRSATISLRARW